MKQLKQLLLSRLGLKMAVLMILALPQLARAQFFDFNTYGDVMLGFRKTGVHAGNYELVVDIGSVTNLLKMSEGSSMTISQFSRSQLTNAFPPGFGDLQWSAFSSFPGSLTPWVTPLGTFPAATIWYTLPGSDVNTQTVPPHRDSSGVQRSAQNLIVSVGTGAKQISKYLAVTNENNNTLLVREPVTYSGYTLSSQIADVSDPTIGNFGASGAPLPQPVENVTPDSFTSARRCDFYQVCPANSTDPITGQMSGQGYFVGYFILNPNGSMTFTRGGGSTPAPMAGFSGAPTSGFAPLQVSFTDASTGSITNWLWSFGDGQSVTNATSASVNHTYTAAGTYTVTLTVSGSGGTDAKTQTGYVVALPTPTLGNALVSGGKLVFSGSNCPAGMHYRILSSTNVASPLGSWKPVETNTFLGDGTFSYTNSMATDRAAFFLLVSP